MSNPFKSKGDKVVSSPNYTKDEMAMFNEAAKMIQAGLKSGATPYDAPTYAKLGPDFYDALDRYESTRNQLMPDIISGMQQGLSGEAGFTANPEEISAYWESALADPAMTNWSKNIAPQIRESFGGGGLFSTRAPQVIGREASSFYGSALVPQLYAAQMQDRQLGIASKEAALDRQAQMLPFATQFGQQVLGSDLFAAGARQSEQQNILTDAFNRFQRMAPETGPWMQNAMSWRGTPSSMSNVYVPRESSLYEKMVVAAVGGMASGLSGMGGMGG